MVVADRPMGPLAVSLQLLLVALLAVAFGDESCEAGSDQCSGRAALLERQLEPEVIRGWSSWKFSPTKLRQRVCWTRC